MSQSAYINTELAQLCSYIVSRVYNYFLSVEKGEESDGAESVSDRVREEKDGEGGR